MTALIKLFKAKAAGKLSSEDLKAATDETLKDKATLKAALKKAKSEYRTTKENETEKDEVTV